MNGDVEGSGADFLSHEDSVAQVEVDARLHGSSQGSGSPAFDNLRDRLASDNSLKGEVEGALRLLVDRVNPSDRGTRFVVGTAVEWIVASAAWAAGVLSAPGGHGVDGVDLQDLEDKARGLWSVKSSFRKEAGPFRITNGLGGAGRGLTDPTVFLHPRLPGATIVHPKVHPDMVERVVQKKDGTDLAFSHVRDHAERHPECVAPLTVPVNQGRGTEDAALLFIKGLLAPERFPRLHDVFKAAEPRTGSVSDELGRLAAMNRDGVLDDAEFRAAKARVLGS